MIFLDIFVLESQKCYFPQFFHLYSISMIFQYGGKLANLPKWLLDDLKPHFC